MSGDEPIPPEGRPLGEYTLIRHLARGGMADIFEARSPVGRPVVVKRIRARMARDPQFVQLFLREAAIAMRLSHGNIAQVFDFGETGGEYYLAMEYVPGVSLHRLLHFGAEQGMLTPFPIAAHVVAEVCRGLDHAHRLTDDDGKPLGIVHRDVTPQNILVSYDGEVKLVDFGIARAKSEAHLTKPGVARGKYAYLSPEQVRQKAVDHRADVWSCGVVFHQILTGQHPFPGEMMAVLEAIAGGKVTPPKAVDPSVPDALSHFVLRALAHDPAERPSAAELEQELVGWLHAEGSPFSADTLGAYVRHVCPPDEASGHHARTPYPRTIEAWRRPIEGESPPPVEADTDAHPIPVPAGGARGVRKAPWLVAGVGLAVIAGLALLLAGRGAITTSSLIETDPPGATILLDGSEVGARTPHVLEDLEPGRVHGITLALDGHRTFMGTFTAGEPVRQVLEPRPAEADRVPFRRRPTLSEVMGTDGSSDSGAIPEEGGTTTWRKALVQARVLHGDLPWVTHPLDPEQAHHFAASGQVDLFHGYLPVSSMLYYASYDDAPDRLGLIGGPFGDLALPPGAHEIRFLILDPVPERALSLHRDHRSGALVVRERTSGAIISVDVTRNAYLPPRMPTRNLRSSRKYRFELALEGDLDDSYDLGLVWMGLADPGGELARLGQGQRITADERIGVLRVGEPKEVEGFRQVWWLLPRPTGAYIEGTAVITVTDIGASRRIEQAPRRRTPEVRVPSKQARGFTEALERAFEDGD